MLHSNARSQSPTGGNRDGNTISKFLPADIASLPVEILARCFVFLPVAFHERLSILHVSRRWRTTALGFTEVWAQIHVTKPSSGMHKLVGKVLARHRAYPFNFSTVHGGTWAYTRGMQRVLEEHIYHLRSLDLPYGWDALLTCAAPMLERISGNAVTAIPANFLGGRAGRLRELTLMDLCLPDAPCAALETVTHLTTTITDESAYRQSPDALFTQFPNLQHLDLDVRTDNESLLPSGPAPLSLVRLRLTSGRATDESESAYNTVDLLAVVQAWRTPALASMDVSWCIPNASTLPRIADGARELAVTVADDPQEAASLVRLMTVDSDGEVSFSAPTLEYTVRAQHADGARYTASIADSPTTAQLAQVLADRRNLPALAQVRRLTLDSAALHEFVILAPSGPDALPCLEELCGDVFPRDEKMLWSFWDMPVEGTTGTSVFPWEHLAVLRMVAAPRGEVRVHATRSGRCFVGWADAEELVSVLRSACDEPSSMSIYVSGFPREVVDAVATPDVAENGPLIVFL